MPVDCDSDDAATIWNNRKDIVCYDYNSGEWHKQDIWDKASSESLQACAARELILFRHDIHVEERYSCKTSRVGTSAAGTSTGCASSSFSKRPEPAGPSRRRS